MKQITEINLTQKDTVELASITNFDQMHIKCFATTEGKNLNGTEFPRNTLLASYKSLIDTHVWIVPDKYGFPTGHGFDFTSAEFDMEKRKNIGHIKNAYPVIVTKDEQIVDVSEMNIEDFPEGELRIVADLAIDKFYFSEIADNLKYLHSINDLFFSMEALTKGVQKEDRRECSEISFTGLAIVSNPAFVNSKSIEIAQRKEEEHSLDFEKEYNELKTKYDTVVAENETLKNASAGITEVATELATAKTELATANKTIDELKVYKEKFETAEKEKLGKTRAEQMKKLGKEIEASELAEKTDVEFAQLVIEAASTFEAKPLEDKDDDEGIDVAGVLSFNHSKKNKFDKLDEALRSLVKEDK